MSEESKRGITAPEGWKRREMPGIPASFDALWTRRDGDTWRYGVLLDERHNNAQGIIHGGVLMTFMDHALSLMIWEASGRAACSTVQLDNNFLSSLKAPCFVELDGEIRRQGKRLAFLRGVLRSEGQDIVEANGVWSISRSAS